MQSSQREHVAPVLTARRLAAFADRVVVRDARARSRRPSLVPTREGLRVAGPFQLRRRLLPTRARGVRFADATGDPNPIHRTGEVVPGAFVAAQFVSAVEVLLPTARLTELRATFNGVCWYDRPLRLAVKVFPEGERLRCEAVALQDEREVASASLQGRFLGALPHLELPLSRVDGAWLMRVVEFYSALGIDAEAYFHKEAGPDLSYPSAFLASLPSGSMVRRLDGAGGLLSRLTLSFGDERLPLRGPPEVSIEVPTRLRASFNRIVTAVRDGVQTAVTGTALVLSGAPLPEPLEARP